MFSGVLLWKQKVSGQENMLIKAIQQNVGSTFDSDYSLKTSGFPNRIDTEIKDIRLLAEKIWRSKINATLIHPTLTYGAPGSNNVERIVRFASLSPFIPIPKEGNTLIQPVSASDLLQGILKCLWDDKTIGRTIIAAGGKSLSYKTFIETCVSSAGKKTKVVFFPSVSS